MNKINKNKILNSNNHVSEKDKFYRIKSNILGTSLVHVSGFNKDYIEYTVNIKTDYSKWSLKKKYEDFYKLNNSLVTIFPEMKNIFPPKKLFFKNSESTTKERVKCFKKYLKLIFKKINIFEFEDIINFIFLEKGIIGLIIKKYNMLKIDEENKIYCSLKKAFNRKKDNKDQDQSNNQEEEHFEYLNHDNYYNAILDFEKKRQMSFDWDEPSSITPNTFVIREFLHNLSENIENKADIIQNFENFLQSQNKWIKFREKEIKELFIGFYEDSEDNDKEEFNRTRAYERRDNKAKTSLFEWSDEKFDIDDDEVEQRIPGLFQQIGDFENNVFAAVGSLDLLEKLLNIEYNPDYEIYITIYKSMNIFEYKYMKLNDLIKNNIGGNKINVKAMKLIYLIFNDIKYQDYKEEILTDKDVYKQYQNYSQNFSE